LSIDKLWATWKKGNSAVQRNMLVDHYQPWVHKLTGYIYKSISGLGLEYLDCFNSANVGLIESIQRFEPNQNASFETYASYRVKGAIYNSIHLYAPEINKYLFQLESSKQAALPLDNSGYEISHTIDELIEDMLLTEILSSVSTMQNTEKLNSYYMEGSDFLLSRSLNRAIGDMPAEYAMVIRYHYFHAYPLKGIAAMLGVSNARVSQMHRDALKQLHDFHV
jgi:RNA polymerase sigma factor, sigma-70 family